MRGEVKHDRLVIRDGWLLCECGSKLMRVEPDTRAENLVVYCRKCKRQHKVNISRGECT